jgi:hypothetical protein
MKKKNDRCPCRLDELVLFISDIAYFAKRWKPIRVEFVRRRPTLLLWRIARKRRVIKAAILEGKKQNDQDQHQAEGAKQDER